LREINQQGGVNGNPLELLVRDNQVDPDLSAQLAEELITQEGVVAIVGPGFSSNAVRVAPVAQQHRVPMITTTATNPTVTSAGDFVFMAAFTDLFQGAVMVEFSRQELGAQTAAILTQAEDVYSEGLSLIFDEEFTARGGEVLARESYAAGDTDFTPQLEVIADRIPDVVFMPGFTPEVPLAIKQARTIPQRNSSGITATFIGGDGWDNAELVAIGGGAVEETFFTGLFAPFPQEGHLEATQNDQTRQFVNVYISMFGIAPDSGSGMGFDALTRQFDIRM
jgi:branched-chain amino acid transport system substrate-binding protein